MIPDRTNYEIWLIDYLDGNLGPDQVDLLMAFLDKNPDVKEEFFEITKYNIKPPDDTFRHKNSLMRSVSEMSESQFEYLCIAASEKDLTDEQSAEMDEILGESSEKRRIYELFLKLKLSPPVIKYSKKHKLRKLTVPQKIIRFSAIGLSAAATVAITITFFKIFSNTNPGEDSGLALLNPGDTVMIISNPPISSGKILPVRYKASVESPVTIHSSLQKSVPDSIKSNSTEAAAPDSSAMRSVVQPLLLSKIDFRPGVNLTELSVPGKLLAINMPHGIISGTEESSEDNGFITRALRKRILKTDEQEKGRLKIYEIADAGILGLNKLFGWNMSLKKNKNEKGEIRSYHFSSKLLKFNIPARKTESLP